MRAQRPSKQCLNRGLIIQPPPTSQSSSLTPETSIVYTLKPIVGIAATTQSNLSLQSIVVFPLELSPPKKTLCCFVPLNRIKFIPQVPHYYYILQLIFRLRKNRIKESIKKLITLIDFFNKLHQIISVITKQKLNQVNGKGQILSLNKLFDKSLQHLHHKIAANMKRDLKSSDVYEPFLPAKDIIIQIEQSNAEYIECLQRLYSISLIKAIVAAIFLAILAASGALQMGNYFVFSEISWICFCYLIKKIYKPHPYYMTSKVFLAFICILTVFLMSSNIYIKNNLNLMTNILVFSVWVSDIVLYIPQLLFLLLLIAKTVSVMRQKKQIQNLQRFKLKPLKIVRWSFHQQKVRKPIKLYSNPQFLVKSPTNIVNSAGFNYFKNLT